MTPEETAVVSEAESSHHSPATAIRAVTEGDRPFGCGFTRNGTAWVHQ